MIFDVEMGSPISENGNKRFVSLSTGNVSYKESSNINGEKKRKGEQQKKKKKII
jgi:hypothetical protein